jgi:hypothetical protein
VAGPAALLVRTTRADARVGGARVGRVRRERAFRVGEG